MMMIMIVKECDEKSRMILSCKALWSKQLQSNSLDILHGFGFIGTFFTDCWHWLNLSNGRHAQIIFFQVLFYGMVFFHVISEVSAVKWGVSNLLLQSPLMSEVCFL